MCDTVVWTVLVYADLRDHVVLLLRVSGVAVIGCFKLWILQCNPSLKTVNKNLLNKWTVPDVVAAVGERGEWG